MDLYIAKISREISGTAPNLTLDGTAEYHADSDSGSDDDDPADRQLSDRAAKTDNFLYVYFT